MQTNYLLLLDRTYLRLDVRVIHCDNADDVRDYEDYCLNVLGYDRVCSYDYLEDLISECRRVDYMIGDCAEVTL